MTKYNINKKDVQKLKKFIKENYKNMNINYTYSNCGFSVEITDQNIAFYQEYLYADITDLEIFE